MANIATLLNTSPVIDTDETCEITVLALEAKISGLGDTYFGDSANWSSIQVEYRSGTGRQREVVTMDVVSPTSSGTFRVSAQARQEAWVIHEIRVKDFDGDFYAVKKADMIPADYNEPTISSGAPVGGTLINAWDGVSNDFQATAGESLAYEFIQSFTPSSNMNISDIDVVLQNQSLQGNFEIAIKSVYNGADLETSNATAIGLVNATNEINVAFSSFATTLLSGTKYYLVIRSVSLASQGGPTAWVPIGNSAGFGTYAGGGYVSQSGPTAGQDTTADIKFKIQGSTV